MKAHITTSLLPLLFYKIENKSDDRQKNINILTYIKFLEASVVILKDYEYLNTTGINIIKFIEQSINHNNYVQPYEYEVSN